MVFQEARLERRMSSGPALYTYRCLPEKPVATVALIHGYADYGGRYAHVAKRWAERGVATVALDLRGHGRAEGTRGHVDRWEEFFDDVAELVRVLEDVEAVTGPTPRFLLGHSNGGLIAARTIEARSYPFRGLITSSAFFRLALPVPGPKVFAGRIASKIVPKLALPSGIPASALTHDAAIAKAYEDDPLVFKTATARWFVETEQAQAKALAEAAKVTVPTLVVHGSADPVAAFSGSKDFFAGVSAADKTFLERPGELHETLNETNWTATADAIVGWLLERA